MEQAPASRPASPVIKIPCDESSAPATPMIKLKFDTRPSLAPSTAARKAFPPTARWRPSSRASALPSIPVRDVPTMVRKRRAWERSSAGIFVVRVSGCASYICRPTSSSVAIVGSTNCGPKRFASQLSPRDRQRGRRGGTGWPAFWRRCSQNRACLSSTMARRRYTSASCGCASISARVR